jgi:prepilin-type N-terminal cleavage/methylation domain-containing protein
MVRGHLRGLNERGVTIAELLMVVAVVGIVSAVGTPYFMSYMQSAALRAAAQELATIISGARQLAIARNTNVCVSLVNNQATYRTGVSNTCGGGTLYLGANTRADGTVTLDNSMTIGGTTASVVFSSLGVAVTAGTYTVRNPTTNRTLSVVVSSMGRVTVQ